MKTNNKNNDRSNADDHANQSNPNHKTHQQIHNSNRRYKDLIVPDWAPDYPDYDD